MLYLLNCIACRSNWSSSIPINSDSDNCSSELLAASDPNFSCTSSFCKTVAKKIIRSNYFIMMISHHILHEHFKNCSMVLQWWELNGLARSDSILDSQYGLSLLVLYVCLMCSLLNYLCSSWAELHTLKIISIILILIITNLTCSSTKYMQQWGQWYALLYLTVKVQITFSCQ